MCLKIGFSWFFRYTYGHFGHRKKPPYETPADLFFSPRPERHDVDLRQNVLAALGVDLLGQQGNPLIHLPTILDTQMLPWVPKINGVCLGDPP